MARPTIHDVAAAAGVSLATVDRVLNDRGGVAAKSVEKVRNAVQKTGYIRDQAAANLSRSRDYRFAFVLPDTGSAFVKALLREIAEEVARRAADRVHIDIRSAKIFDAAAQAGELRALDRDNTDCVAVMAADAPAVRDQIRRLTGEGVKVITLVADVTRSDRAAYVGIDNAVAGRTAASFMGRFIRNPSGPVLAIAGSLAARDHAERLMGFQQVLRADYPGLTLLPAVEGADDPGRIAQLVTETLAAHPLVGIYAMGAGNRGLLNALRPLDPRYRPVTIVHELTPTGETALKDNRFDLVIDQDPARAVRRAMNLMRDLSDGHALPPDAGHIPLNIFVKENI